MFDSKVGAYIRLSRDDNYSDSYSIDNQTKMIETYCDKNKLMIIDYYIDNGYSGTNFDRPRFNELIEDINKGKINTIIVKDLSRLGRNYIEVGQFLEYYFPNRKVRFISINDNYDSFKDVNMMDRIDLPFKNVMYDYFAFEISKKLKRSLSMEKRKGKFIGSSSVYGYIKDPKDRHKLIIDKEAAEIVREIFNMYLLGVTKSEIADILNDRNVSTPAYYKKEKGIGYASPQKENKWNFDMIDRILKDENYAGSLVQNKSRNVDYRTHKEVRNPKEQWIIIENHHKAIIDKKEFLKVQEMLKIQRRKPIRKDMLLFYLKCGDCFGPMTPIKGKKNEYYYCRNYTNKKICTKHVIRKEYLINEIINQINQKYLGKRTIKNLTEKVLEKQVSNIYIYEDNRVEVRMKYEEEISK